MTLELVECRLCGKDRLTKRQVRRHGRFVTTLGRIAIVTASAITAVVALIGIEELPERFAMNRLVDDMTLTLLTSFGVAVAVMLLGAFCFQTRHIMWCKTCGAVTEVMIGPSSSIK